MYAGLEQWRGKRVAFIGDSITEGVGSERAYHEYLAEWLGLEALNYGVNGAQTDEMLGFARRLRGEHPNVDAVFALGGTMNAVGALAASVERWMVERRWKGTYRAHMPRSLYRTRSSERGRHVLRTARRKRGWICEAASCSDT